MKVLVFSRSIYPHPGGSSYVIEQLASNFTHDELIVFGEKDIINGKEIVRDPQKAKFIYLRTGISLAGRAARFFYWIRWLIFPFAYFKVLNSLKERNIDYIVGVFPDEFYLLLSCKIAKKLSIPFSSYFHNTYIENRKSFQLWLGKAIQEEVFNKSDNVFLISEGLLDYYNKKFAEKKFKTLVHTFNEYPKIKLIKEKISEPYNLGLFGNFNESNIEATIRVVNALKTNKKYIINFYTPVPILLLKTRGIDINCINYHGYVSEDKFFEEIQKNDILILTHGFEGGYSRREYETIFPTRTIPMLTSGIPIFVHAPEFSYLSKFVRETNCAALVDQPDKTKIMNTVEIILDNIEYRKVLINNALEISKQFYGPYVKSQFINTLLYNSK